MKRRDPRREIRALRDRLLERKVIVRDEHLIGMVGATRVCSFYMPKPGVEFDQLPSDGDHWPELRKLVVAGAERVILTPGEERALFADPYFSRRLVTS